MFVLKTLFVDIQNSKNILPILNVRHVERVVVTGGAGFVGRHFVKRCLEQGYNVTIIDNLSNYNVSNDDDSLVSADGSLSFYREDITNRNTLSDIFSHEKVDTCVHLAGKN